MRRGGAGGRLRGIDLKESVRILAIKPEERRALASERIHLLDLPGGELLEPLERAVVVLETRQLVIAPDDGDVASAHLIRSSDDEADKVHGLDRSGNDELLIRLDVHTIAHEELGVEALTGLKALHGERALGVAHGDVAHGIPFDLAHGDTRMSCTQPSVL